MIARLRDADHRLGGVGAHRQHVAFLGGPVVIYQEFAPPPELASWVAVFWRIASEVTFELRVAPDGCMDLIRDDVVGFSRASADGDVSAG